MFLPTIYSNEDNLIHIVKDKQSCECQFTYHHYYLMNKRDFKKIKFKHIKDITCPICKASIKIGS